MDMNLVYSIIFFLLVALIPSVLWIAWLRKKVPTGPGLMSVLLMFGWGAIFAVIIALVLNTLIPGFSPRTYGTPMFFVAVIVAPFVEEMAKPLGLRFAEFDITRIRDGVILGATAGLGFAATENLLYELTALNDGGWASFWATAIIRSIAACALHASATAMTGRGYAWVTNNHKTILLIIPFYLVAVFLHGLYNYLAISGDFLLVLAALGLAILAMVLTGKSVD